MIDEADESMPGMAVAGGSSSKRKREASESLPNPPARKRQRKPGPLPKHISLANRPTTPPITLSTPTSTPPSTPDSRDEEPELASLPNNSKETLLRSLLTVSRFAADIFVTGRINRSSVFFVSNPVSLLQNAANCY